jgi:hypothetical protein
MAVSVGLKFLLLAFAIHAPKKASAILPSRFWMIVAS